MCVGACIFDTICSLSFYFLKRQNTIYLIKNTVTILLLFIIYLYYIKYIIVKENINLFLLQKSVVFTLAVEKKRVDPIFSACV